MTYSIQKRNLPINVSVHFDKNGGDSVSYEYAQYKLGEKYGSFPTATKDDNFFEGWYKESSATNKVLSSDEVDFRQETLFAGYTPLKEMTFNADGGTFTGGSDVVTKKFAPNHPFSLYGLPENPTKTDLNFCGWYTGLSATGTKITGNSIVPSVPTTYYADWRNQAWTVNLNSQWRVPQQWTNTDERFTVYESYSNYNKSNGVATMYINLTGYTEFTIYINSYAESYYDYTKAYEADTSTQKQSTYGYQYNPSSYRIDSGTGWKKVTYTLDGGIHQIKVDYRKDSSVNSNWDRGYVAIPN